MHKPDALCKNTLSKISVNSILLICIWKYSVECPLKLDLNPRPSEPVVLPLTILLFVPIGSNLKSGATSRNLHHVGYMTPRSKSNKSNCASWRRKTLSKIHFEEKNTFWKSNSESCWSGHSFQKIYAL